VRRPGRRRRGLQSDKPKLTPVATSPGLSRIDCSRPWLGIAMACCWWGGLSAVYVWWDDEKRNSAAKHTRQWKQDQERRAKSQS